MTSPRYSPPIWRPATTRPQRRGRRPAALWAVAAIAVISGTGLLRVLSVRTLRLATAVVLLGLAVYSTVTAVQG